MIGVNIRGSNFGGAQNYLFAGNVGAVLDPDRVSWHELRNLPVSDPHKAAAVMQATASQNPRVEKPVEHIILNPPPEAELSRRTMRRIAERTLEDMGLGEHQALIVEHHDLERRHLHILVNRVHPETLRAWDPSFSKRRMNVSLDRQSRELGLLLVRRRETAALHPGEDLSLSLTKGAYQQALRRGREPFADFIRERARTALLTSSSWDELQGALGKEGLAVEARGAGLIVTDGQEVAKASSIDRDASRRRIEVRLGETFASFRERGGAVSVRPGPALRPLAPKAPSAASAVSPGAEPPSVRDAVEAMLDRLARDRAVFTKAELKRYSFWHGKGRDLCAEALTSNRLIELRTDEAGRVFYTTADYLEAEGRLFGAAERLTGAEAGPRVREEGRATHLAENRHDLSEEQKTAVRRVTSERGLELLSGRAGSGKSRLFREVADLYEAEGFQVRGAALSGAAAENLGQAAGIEARTLASLETSWRAGRERLTRRDVLIVDEAGMVGTRQLAGALEEAQEAGAKVILAGDQNQLRPIEAGEPFRGLLAEHGGAHLGTIRRQRLPWQAEASVDLAEGRIAEALATYDNAGRIEWYPDRRAALDDLVLRYREDSLARPEETRLALAYRREDAAHLNEKIRAGRKELGQLGEDVSVGGKPYAAGDRILFLRNDHRGRSVKTIIPTTDGARGVKNGTFATLESVSPIRIEARLDTGRRVAFDPERYSTFGHGYAATVHKAQGATVDRAYFVPDRLIERDAAYVALTRHARDLSLHVDRASFATERELQTSLAREPLRDLARDHRSVVEIVRVAEQTARRRELKAALSEIAEGRHRVERSVEELARLEARAWAHLVELRTSLAAVYRDPRAAEVALVAAVDKYGPQRTAEILRTEPQRFGRLPGRGGLLPWAARREALEASRSAAHHLNQWAASRESLAVASTTVVKRTAPPHDKTLFQKGRALRGNISVARSAGAFAKELGSLPNEEALGQTASRALKMVGFAAVAQAVPTAVYLSALAASSAYRMVRDIGRGKGPGRGGGY